MSRFSKFAQFVQRATGGDRRATGCDRRATGCDRRATGCGRFARRRCERAGGVGAHGTVGRTVDGLGDFDANIAPAPASSLRSEAGGTSHVWRVGVAAVVALATSAASLAQPLAPPTDKPADVPAPAPAPASPATPAPTAAPAAPQAGGPELVRTAQNNAAANEMTPELDEAIDQGLKYLVAEQQADGSFGNGRYGKNIAVTALACIALMADGNTPGRGRYGKNVQRGLEFVLSSSTETGLLAADSTNGPMYGHGFAALFLGEAYGMTKGGGETPLSTRVHEALVKACTLIQRSQNSEGGWRYNPVPYDADISVTICQIMALRSARNAGIEVPKETIDKAVEYVRQCQNADGGFRYQASAGVSAWPRSAAGVAALFYAGIYKDDAIDRGVKYVQSAMAPGNNGANSSAHYFYGHYYSVQSMYLAGGESWAKWWVGVRAELLAKQQKDGSWMDPSVGPAYGTSMALIVLQMPKRFLPIFQK